MIERFRSQRFMISQLKFEHAHGQQSLSHCRKTFRQLSRSAAV